MDWTAFRSYLWPSAATLFNNKKCKTAAWLITSCKISDNNIFNNEDIIQRVSKVWNWKRKNKTNVSWCQGCTQKGRGSERRCESNLSKSDAWNKTVLLGGNQCFIFLINCVSILTLWNNVQLNLPRNNTFKSTCIMEYGSESLTNANVKCKP